MKHTNEQVIQAIEEVRRIKEDLHNKEHLYAGILVGILLMFLVKLFALLFSLL